MHWVGREKGGTDIESLTLIYVYNSKNKMIIPIIFQTNNHDYIFLTILFCHMQFL